MRTATPERRRSISGAGLYIVAALAMGADAASVAAQTAIPPKASDFATSAVQAGQYEIEAAEVALAQSRDLGVRAFARQMIDDHTRAIDTMRQAALTSGLPSPPRFLASDQASLLGALQGLRGPEFDRAYAHQQILAHAQALAVEQSYASAGTDTHLRTVAQSDVTMIQHHLQEARQLGATLGEP